VIPGLVRKFHEAKIQNKPAVEIWGSGKPRREFLYLDDLADACVSLMENYAGKDTGILANIGTGEDVSIKELAEMIKRIVGYRGELIYNTEKPDGAPRKLLEVFKLHALGWQARTLLEDGIRMTYEWYAQKKPYNYSSREQYT
jgi:GDP-L-fucose synthase